MAEYKQGIIEDDYYEDLDDSSSSLIKKKRKLYRLLAVTVCSAVIFTAWISYQLTQLRQGDAEITTVYNALRTDTPLLLLKISAFNKVGNFEDEFGRISYLLSDWNDKHHNFLKLLRTREYYSDQVDAFEEAILVLNSKYSNLEKSMITLLGAERGIAEASICEDCITDYLAELEVVWKVTSSASLVRLNHRLTLSLILLVGTALVFCYLFIFQMRPLFNELVVKNKEFRRISVKQSHIMRAPVANILGLLFLCDQSQNVAELKKYLGLIQLNANAIDERIHQIVEASETVQDFDGSQKKLQEQIIISEDKVENQLKD